jgi:hypothetical protein
MEDITSDMVMPYYHVVEFGNRLPSTECKAIAKMSQPTRCYPFNDGRYCGGQMPEYLPSLVPMDPMEDIPSPKGYSNPGKGAYSQCKMNALSTCISRLTSIAFSGMEIQYNHWPPSSGGLWRFPQQNAWRHSRDKTVE